MNDDPSKWSAKVHQAIYVEELLTRGLALDIAESLSDKDVKRLIQKRDKSNRRLLALLTAQMAVVMLVCGGWRHL